jgi:hypothetical protein
MDPLKLNKKRVNFIEPFSASFPADLKVKTRMLTKFYTFSMKFKRYLPLFHLQKQISGAGKFVRKKNLRLPPPPHTM